VWRGEKSLLFGNQIAKKELVDRGGGESCSATAISLPQPLCFPARQFSKTLEQIKLGVKQFHVFDTPSFVSFV
jgi:hypothetical protein